MSSYIHAHLEPLLLHAVVMTEVTNFPRTRFAHLKRAVHGLLYVVSVELSVLTVGRLLLVC